MPLSSCDAIVMSESIEYALSALLLYGVADFVYKRGATAGAKPHHFLMVQTWFFTPCALLYGLTSGTLAFNASAFWGCGRMRRRRLLQLCPQPEIGIGQHQRDDLSTKLRRHRGAGDAGVGGAAHRAPRGPCARGRRGLAAARDAKRRDWRRSTREPVFPSTRTRRNHGCRNSELCLQVGPASRCDADRLVVTQGLVAVTLSTGFTIYVDRRIRPSHAAWSHAPVAAVLLVTAFTFLAKGLKASVIVPVAQMGFVVTALLGFILLREPFTARKGAGLAAVLAALACLAKG